MKIKGVLPALATPLNADESINTDALKKLINYLMEKKADGFYIGGGTGEGHNLRIGERMKLAEEAVKEIGGRVPAIIQVASTVFSSAVELARHAENIGADAISATAPLYFSYDENDVYNYYKTLAESVHIPVMVYYSPQANFKMNANFAARLFEIDNITAIKWTSSDYYEMVKLHDMTKGEMSIINGFDEMLLMGLSAGADAGIGTTYNFMLENFRGIYDNFSSGNIEKAQEIQAKTDRIISALLKYQVIPATKVVLRNMGFDVGEASFPMKRYTKSEEEKIVSEIRAVGLKI